MSNDNPHISILSQYVKDFSFENPHAPASLLKQDVPPKVDISIDLSVVEIKDQENTFEVSITIETEAKSDEKRLFLVELVYAGIFTLTNIPEEQMQIALAVHCPSLIFPFARRIISDMTQDAGFQPLRIDPIDFGKLYQSKMEEIAKEQRN